MTAETIAKALGGRKAGGGWMARCPAHDDRTPSLSIRDADDGKVLVRCHAGCDQASVIAALRARGLWAENGRARLRGRRVASLYERQNRIATTPSAPRRRSPSGRHPSRPQGTPVETYLRSRGIHLPPPRRLRFHAGLKHPSGGIWPAMVALVTRGGTERRSPSTAPFSPATAPGRRRSTGRR